MYFGGVNSQRTKYKPFIRLTFRQKQYLPLENPEHDCVLCATDPALMLVIVPF